MADDWITCPRCEAEGEVGMEWIGERFVSGSGTTCPLCKGDMGFGDEIELKQAEDATSPESSTESREGR